MTVGQVKSLRNDILLIPLTLYCNDDVGRDSRHFGSRCIETGSEYLKAGDSYLSSRYTLTDNTI